MLCGRERGFLFDPLHDGVVGIAEPVDRLLCVSHHEKASPLRKGVLYERKEVLPLYGGGVLKLVNQVMIDDLTEPEIDVRDDGTAKVLGKVHVYVFYEDLPLLPLRDLDGPVKRLIGPQVRHAPRAGIHDRVKADKLFKATPQIPYLVI